MNRKQVTTMMFMLAVLFFSQAATGTVYAACTTIPTGPYPKTLAASNTYCLTGNITVNGTTAFLIGGDNITFDLSGFHIRNSAAPGSTFGIFSSGPYKNISIKNGRISGFFGGIYLSNISNSIVDGISISDYTEDGIQINGGGNIVRNCQIFGGSPSNYGIVATGSRFKAINNDITDVFEAGIWISGGGLGNDCAIIENNRIVGLSSQPSSYWIGIEVEDTNSLIVNNRIENFDVGISFENGATGKFRDNLTSNCTTTYVVIGGVVDAGNNN